MPETDKKQEIMLEILENKSNGVANLVGNVFGSIYPQRPAVTDALRNYPQGSYLRLLGRLFALWKWQLIHRCKSEGWTLGMR